MGKFFNPSFDSKYNSIPNGMQGEERNNEVSSNISFKASSSSNERIEHIVHSYESRIEKEKLRVYNG